MRVRGGNAIKCQGDFSHMHKHTDDAPARGLTTPLRPRGNMETITGNSHTYASEPEARAAFARKKDLFLDVNHWDALGPPDPARSTFTLHDSAGHKVVRRPEVG